MDLPGERDLEFARFFENMLLFWDSLLAEGYPVRGCHIHVLVFMVLQNNSYTVLRQCVFWSNSYIWNVISNRVFL